MDDGIKKLDRLPITNKHLWTVKGFGCYCGNNEMIACWQHKLANDVVVYYTRHVNYIDHENPVFEGISLWWEHDDVDTFRMRDDTDENGIYDPLYDKKEL